jgi:isoamylase
MTDEEWNSGFIRCFGMCLGGEAMEEFDERGERVTDDTFLLLFNADGLSIDFTLPDCGAESGWAMVLDTSDPALQEGEMWYRDGENLTLQGRSMVVLRATTPGADE